MILEALRARKRIAPFVQRTPLVDSAWLSEHAGRRVSLKLESLQASNSFKRRGAFNALIARLERGDLTATSTIVTASAGNHGRALAAAAEAFRLPLVVFTPHDAPQTKTAAIRRHGATLRAEGRDYDHAELLAKAFAAETGAVFVSPYSDADVVAGAATVALEIFEDAPDVDLILVPIGGGGLASGVAATARAIAPAAAVVGVELAVSHAFLTSIHAGRLVQIDAGPSIAEGLGGNPDPDTITFSLVQQYVNEIVTVTETELRDAVVGMVEFEHLVVEASGAAGVAAVLASRPERRASHTVVVVTGSNIDFARLTSLLRRD